MKEYQLNQKHYLTTINRFPSVNKNPTTQNSSTARLTKTLTAVDISQQ
jgi:hypothetical protein